MVSDEYIQNLTHLYLQITIILIIPQRTYETHVIRRPQITKPHHNHGTTKHNAHSPLIRYPALIKKTKQS